MTTANRGKAAEAVVKKILKSMEDANTVVYRPPDFRSGSATPAPCDYMVLRGGQLTLIEVKSVEHLRLLPHKNFAPDQVARMRMWVAAGAEALVFVYFVPTKQWKLCGVKWFLDRTGGSWNFSEVPALDDLKLTLEDLL